jgi:hypothetical protein
MARLYKLRDRVSLKLHAGFRRAEGYKWTSISLNLYLPACLSELSKGVSAMRIMHFSWQRAATLGSS